MNLKIYTKEDYSEIIIDLKNAPEDVKKALCQFMPDFVEMTINNLGYKENEILNNFNQN